jgi:putative SOS response-associated peptidase YedK
MVVANAALQFSDRADPGRRADKQRIAEWMQAHSTNVFDGSYFAPSFNVAPYTMQPAVWLDSETGQTELTVMRWGLVLF